MSIALHIREMAGIDWAPLRHRFDEPLFVASARKAARTLGAASALSW
jgi:hypothetical protein